MNDPTIVLATGNPHKLEELRAIFASQGLQVHLRALSEMPGAPFPEPAETGASFQPNADIKALEYARRTGAWSLADDSGLEIDALAGRPGVISSHYASDGIETGIPREERDRANNQRVLRELADVPEARRSARFVCVMSLARATAGHAEIFARSRGVFEGRIGSPPAVPRGALGFGYDPLLLVAPDYTRTSAELSPHEKNSLSHRGTAARAMAAEIRRLISLGLFDCGNPQRAP